MRRNGEDIIITKTGEMAEARKQAAKISKSKNHSWCNIWYVSPQTKRITRLTYHKGRDYTYMDELDGKGLGGFWYSATLTIREAMSRYCESAWIQAHL